MKRDLLSPLLKAWVDEEKIAGVNVLITKDDQPFYKASFGMADRENGVGMTEDKIFRVFSMSKPVTAVGLLKLYEKGLIRLYDPVEKFLPGFKDQRVAVEEIDRQVRLEPVARPMTVRDLLTMTSGMPYEGTDGYCEKEMLKVLNEMKKAEGTDKAWDTVKLANAMGRVPLRFQPGKTWMYGVSADVVGAIIEVVSGQTLEDYMQKEVFGPLGMKDTTYHLPEEKRSRLAHIYHMQGKMQKLPVEDLNFWCGRDKICSGGGGMYSTVNDYSRFCRMLANGGALDGVQILGRKTIALMASDHLTPEQKSTDVWATQRGYGYGLLVRVMNSRATAESNGSDGEFGWDGYAGTYMCVDPVENLTAVYLVGRVPGAHEEFIPRFTAAMYAML